MRLNGVYLTAALLLSACAAPADTGLSGGPKTDSPRSPSCPVSVSSLRSVSGKAPFAESRLSYTDPEGRLLRRHVITEQERNGHTLLLVVEEPPSPGLAQRVVLRKSFAPNESEALERARAGALDQNALSALASSSFLTLTNNPVWPIDRAWRQADEVDYARWVESVASEEMLTGTGIEVDCAEYAMTLRWIYARDHHLPAGDKQSVSGNLWGSWQSTAEWDALPTAANWKDDRRFKAALHYALSNSYTHALHDDLYPVAINRDFVTGGTIYLTLQTSSGHTRTIFKVGSGGACSSSASCISIIYGTLPASENGYIVDLAPYRVDEGWGGFMRFRWPERAANGTWSLRAATAMPGYSREQYQWDDAEYGQKISDRLELWASAEERLVGTGQSLLETINLRLRVTERGYFLCSLMPCAPSDSLYNDWSTPERDATLAAQLRAFQATASLANLNDYYVREFFDENSEALFEGAPFSKSNILMGNLHSQFNSDPRTSFFDRWGIRAPNQEAVLRGLARAAFDNWRWRDDLIAQAQSVCFPNGDSTAQCDPNSAQVRALETSRLDAAFVKAQTEFARLFNVASTSVKESVRAQLQSEFTGASFCSPGSCGNSCSMEEFLLLKPEKIRSMTSSPLDPISKRYGF